MLKTLCALTLAAGFATIAPAASYTPITFPVSSAGGSFVGNFHLTGFHYETGNVFADGIVTGTVSNAGKSYSVVQTVSQALTLPPKTPSAASTSAAPAAAASCPILSLDLGPLNLNILGLQVTTNEIVLNITAIPGPGNLLGNLLCSIAGLLDSPSQQLAALLNQILNILSAL